MRASTVRQGLEFVGRSRPLRHNAPFPEPVPTRRSTARKSTVTAHRDTLRAFFRVLGLAPLALAACGGSGDAKRLYRPEQRLLVIGWDGATFDLVDPLVAAGRLPNLATLMRTGVSARLTSTLIPISSAAWVGAVTGKGPGQTGVYSFFEPVEGTYDVRLISSHSNAASPIWRILTGHGLGVNVFGVPVTYPPESVLGTMVAGMLSPFEADYAWPPEYTQELRDRGFLPDLGKWTADQDLSWARLLEQLRIKEEVVLELLARPDWDFSMVVFKNLDVLSHHRYGIDGSVEELLEALDATLGKLIERAGPDTNVIVMSDHGFASYPTAFNVHTWLIEEGFAVLNESHEDARPEAGPLGAARAREHERRLGELDLARTKAFATVSEGNFGSLRLNLAGREPAGTVAPTDKNAVLEEITRALRRLVTADGRTPLVRRILRGSELYPGRFADRRVPDIVFETQPDWQVVSTSYLPTRTTYPTPMPDHALEGILIMSGPAIAHSEARGGASVLDFAPTALHLLNQPVYAEMSGRVLTHLLALDRVPHEIREEDDPLRRTAEHAAAPFTEADRRAIRERLEELGYS